MMASIHNNTSASNDVEPQMTTQASKEASKQGSKQGSKQDLKQAAKGVVRSGFWFFKRTSLPYLVFVLLGSFIIISAVLQLLNAITLQAFLLKLTELFSTSFVVIFSLLVMLAIIAITKLQKNEYRDYWSEIGLQVANGISALALTFTLLGISLGIGSLSEQSLTPENVQALINQLTQHFSMAFMTTVVGLPTATIIRAIVSVRYQRVNMIPINEMAKQNS